jgi:chorismate-pyruvate lyase
MAGLFHPELMREVSMTLSAQQIIDAFERLPEPEKQTVAHEILRRSVQLQVPSLTDEELVVAAEDLFLTLDAREAGNDSSDPGRGLVT